MKTKIRPLFDRVLIKPVEQEKQTGGIIIPDNAKERPQRGMVIAVGEEVVVIKKGDAVLYGKYSGMELDHEEQEYLIMKQEEVYAIV